MFGPIRTFQIIFDRPIEPFFPSSVTNWLSYYDNTFFELVGGFVSGRRLQLNTVNLGYSPGPNRVSYFADPPVVRSLLDGTPAAPFLDFPVR